MTDKTNATAVATTPKFKVGDLLVVPTHNGTYTAEVKAVYKDLESARAGYERSFNTILQSPHGKAEPNQPFYFCHVANATAKHVGVAEEHAKLKKAKK